MRKAVRCLYFLLLTMLASCNPSGQDGLKVSEVGALVDADYAIDNKDARDSRIDFEEFVLSSPERVIDVVVRNRTPHPYKELNLQIVPESVDLSPAFSFVPLDSGELIFPGGGGTCSSVLPARQSCTIKLQLNPRSARLYKDKVILSYKNLLNEEKLETQLQVLAGELGSLVFEDEVIQFVFGNLIGITNPVPVVERNDDVPFQKILRLRNAGGLSVRGLRSEFVEQCSSTLTNLCPENMGGAYTFTSRCPERLLPGEFCEAVVDYLPKNKDPLVGPVPGPIEEIRYNATARFDFVTGPENKGGVLNGYFRSVASTIEARFRTGINLLSFETTLGGNRTQRTIRISNSGYREGEMISLRFRDSDGSVLANCRAQNGEYLGCFDSSNQSISLERFPFVIKDKNACLRSSQGERKYIDIGAGCNFDVIFQPSTLYQDSKTFDLKLQLVYDSRWRGSEVIKDVTLLDIKADSKPVARLVPISLTYNGNTYDLDQNGRADLGRLPLLSAAFVKRRAFNIVFKNFGQEPATELVFKDGSGRVIPASPSSQDLGQKTPRFYQKVTAGCSSVPPNGECRISGEFAPISMPTVEDENSNMFDAKINGIDFKNFHITYTSGALFSDLNTQSAEPDYGPREVVAGLTATLVRKAYIQEITDDARNLSTLSSLVAGETGIGGLYLTNIGSGTAYDLRQTTAVPTGYQVIETPDDELENYQADYDCARINHLPKEKNCIYRYRFKVPLSHLNSDPLRRPPTVLSSVVRRIQELSRFYSRSEDRWEYLFSASQALAWNDIAWRYFDGDVLPSTGPMGTVQSLVAFNQSVESVLPAKLTVIEPRPWHSGVIYRSGFELPAVPSVLAAHTVCPVWIDGQGSTLLTCSPELFIGVDVPSTIVRGRFSRNGIPANILNQGNSFDYVYYLGAFPRTNSILSIFPKIQNIPGSYQNARAIIKSVNVISFPGSSLSPAPDRLPVEGLILNSSAMTQDSQLELRLNQDVDVSDQMLGLEIQYENGLCTSERTFLASPRCASVNTSTLRVLFAAQIIPTPEHSALQAKYFNVDVSQASADMPPEATLDTSPISLPLVWNQVDPNAAFIMDSLKITTVSDNSLYALKKVVLKNTSPVTIPKLDIVYRTSITSFTPVSRPASLSFLTDSADPMGNCDLDTKSLAPDEECYLLIRYRPGINDQKIEKAIISFVYDLKNGSAHPVLQSFALTLEPRSPATLDARFATNSTNLPEVPVRLNYNEGQTPETRNSRALPLGNIRIDSSIVTRRFDGTLTSSPLKRITLRNRETTKASLLKSYHEYLKENNLRGYGPTTDNKDISSVVPAADEYQNIGGISYVLIYSKENGRVRVFASEGCLFGDDRYNNAILGHLKGFTNAPTTSAGHCHIIPEINLTSQDFNNKLNSNDANLTRLNSIRLDYYDLNRASSNTIIFHFTGHFLPPEASGSGVFGSVVSQSDRQVSFVLPNLSPQQPSLGEVLGVRVYFSTNPTHLSWDSVFAQSNGSRSYVDTSSGTVNFSLPATIPEGTMVFFRPYLIRRQQGLQLPAGRFLNLNPDEYLSDITNGNFTRPLAVTVPYSGMSYIHHLRLLLDTGRTLDGGNSNMTYDRAISLCSSKRRTIKRNGTDSILSMALVSPEVWQLVLNHTELSSYQVRNFLHWLQGGIFNLNTVFAGVSGYNTTTDNQFFDDVRMSYLRGNGIRRAFGPVPETNLRDHDFYFPGEIPYGHTRCMLNMTSLYPVADFPW